ARTGRREVLPLQRGEVELVKRAARRKQTSAADVVPRAGDGGEERDRAHGRSAAAVSLQSVVEADERRARRRVAMREVFDHRRLDAANVRDFFRRVIAQYAIAQSFPAKR